MKIPVVVAVIIAIVYLPIFAIYITYVDKKIGEKESLNKYHEATVEKLKTNYTASKNKHFTAYDNLDRHREYRFVHQLDHSL